MKTPKQASLVREFQSALREYIQFNTRLRAQWKVACKSIASLVVAHLELPDSIEVKTRWNSDTEQYTIKTDDFIIRIRPNLESCFIYCVSSGKNDNRGGVDRFSGDDDLDFTYQTMIAFCRSTYLVSESQLSLF